MVSVDEIWSPEVTSQVTKSMYQNVSYCFYMFCISLCYMTLFFVVVKDVCSQVSIKIYLLVCYENGGHDTRSWK